MKSSTCAECVDESYVENAGCIHGRARRNSFRFVLILVLLLVFFFFREGGWKAGRLGRAQSRLVGTALPAEIKNYAGISPTT